MLLGYVDESYERGERYWLVVALVPAGNVPQLAEDVRRVPRILPPEHSEIAGVEMHGHALFHGSKGFQPLAGLIDLRVRLYRRGLQALVRAATDIVFVGVDWADHSVPHDLGHHRMHAVRRLLPALEGRIGEMREHCLLIADEEEATRREFTAAVREHKRCCVEDAGECRIVDNVLFVDSRDSPGVQCVDLAAYLHHRVDSARGRNKRARTANRKLYRVLEGCRIRSLVFEGPTAPIPVPV